MFLSEDIIVIAFHREGVTRRWTTEEKEARLLAVVHFGKDPSQLYTEES
jgi:hypothetical protein